MTATFLSPTMARQIQARFGTPVHVYHLETLVQQAQRALNMPNPFGLTVRFAMKACPNGVILRLFDRLGLHIDASSGYELHRALHAGIDPARIQLTAQEMPSDLQEQVERGVLFNATSLHQLATFGRLFPGRELSIRVNPGLGSGHNPRATVGGPLSSFGIWHEQMEEVRAIQQQYGLKITRLHSHIGSGADPAIWQRCAELTLQLAHDLPQVHTVNLGGGFKVARVAGESETDLHAVGKVISAQLQRFRREDAAQRALHLEIEPGTFLVAHAGAIVSTVIDLKDTGAGGHRFIVVDSGMTDNMRPALYGAQHPLFHVPAEAQAKEGESSDGASTQRAEDDFLVVGHCCESGDLLTPAPGDPEQPLPRRLPTPRIGDALIIGKTGAYGASMAVTNYNSFPQSAELLLMPDGEIHVIRRRQPWQEMTAREELPAVWPAASAWAAAVAGQILDDMRFD